MFIITVFISRSVLNYFGTSNFDNPFRCEGRSYFSRLMDSGLLFLTTYDEPHVEKIQEFS